MSKRCCVACDSNVTITGRKLPWSNGKKRWFSKGKSLSYVMNARNSGNTSSFNGARDWGSSRAFKRRGFLYPSLCLPRQFEVIYIFFLLSHLTGCKDDFSQMIPSSTSLSFSSRVASISLRNHHWWLLIRAETFLRKHSLLQWRNWDFETTQSESKTSDQLTYSIIKQSVTLSKPNYPIQISACFASIEFHV